jgi:hypothetical protein
MAITIIELARGYSIDSTQNKLAVKKRYCNSKVNNTLFFIMLHNTTWMIIALSQPEVLLIRLKPPKIMHHRLPPCYGTPFGPLFIK